MNNFNIKLSLSSLLAVVLFISSCNKDNNNALTEGSTVRLKIGQTYVQPSPTPAKVGSIGRTYTAAAQTIEVPFNNEYTIVAKLTPVTTNSISSGLKSSNRAETAPSNATPSKIALKQGTVYKIAIFDQAGNYKETKSFSHSSVAADFPIAKGKYTFIIYASGTGKALSDIQAGATLSTVSFTDLTADVDFMWDRIEFEVKDGENIIDADLAHLFTQVTLKFDASKIGSVTGITGAHISPSNTTANIALSSGSITYTGTKTDPINFNLKNTTGTLIKSDSTFLHTPVATAGTVVLTGLSIEGSTPRNLTFSNLPLNPGVRYTLDLQVKAPVSVNIGGEVWALNDLGYNSATNEYSFGTGDYWFPNRLLPKRLDGTNQGSDASNGGTGDPCLSVAPANSWRLPKEEELQTLINNTNSGGADNPNKNTWEPARYVDYFDGIEGSQLGMFFGVMTSPLTLPAADRGKYLFFAYKGYYPNNNETVNGTIGKEAAYLTRTASGGYRVFHLTGKAKDLGYGIGWRDQSADEAVRIRCVRN